MALLWLSWLSAGLGMLLASPAWAAGGGAGAPTPRPLPAADSGIHLGLAFDSSIPDPSIFKGRVDYIWGASPATLAWGIHSDAYAPYDRDPNEPVLPLAWWRQNHPDWISYRCDRVTPATEYGNPNVPLDIANPEVQQFQATWVARRMAQGFQGIAWDNVRTSNDFGRCGVWQGGRWVQKYSGAPRDERFMADAVAWAHAEHDLLRAAVPGIGITFNLSADVNEPSMVSELSPWFDMVFDENGFTDGGAKQVVGAAWDVEATYVKQVQAAGKGIILAGIVAGATDAEVSPADVEWVLGNYLLMKDARTFTNVYAAGASGRHSYGAFFDRPQFAIPIGSPSGPAVDQNGAKVRAFDGGLVVVNPTAEDKTVTVPPGLSRWNGENAISPVGIAGGTAQIFLGKVSLPSRLPSQIPGPLAGSVTGVPNHRGAERPLAALIVLIVAALVIAVILGFRRA